MIINCTPHNINIYSTADCYIRDGFLCFRAGELDDEGELPQPFRTYPAAKEPARVTFVQKPAGMADGILIYWEDFIFPGTLVRNESGDVVGCIDFSRV